MMAAKQDVARSFLRAGGLMRIAALAAGALVLAACAPQAPTASDIGTSAQGLTAGGSAAGVYSPADVQTAYNRAQRIRDLLANCSGAAAPAANAEANNMAQAQMGLGNILAGITANTPANRDQAVGAMLAVQSDAYTAAVACGVVAPNVPDPGGWNATWDDISS